MRDPILIDMTKPDIKTLAQQRKFGEIENAVYEDRSLIGPLVELLSEKNGDVRSGVLNLLSRVGFDFPNDTRPHLGKLIALLDDPDMFVKIDAANAVGNLGFNFKDSASQAAPRLKSLLDHEQSLVRQEAESCQREEKHGSAPPPASLSGRSASRGSIAPRLIHLPHEAAGA